VSVVAVHLDLPLSLFVAAVAVVVADQMANDVGEARRGVEESRIL